MNEEKKKDGDRKADFSCTSKICFSVKMTLLARENGEVILKEMSRKMRPRDQLEK